MDRHMASALLMTIYFKLYVIPAQAGISGCMFSQA